MIFLSFFIFYQCIEQNDDVLGFEEISKEFNLKLKNIFEYYIPIKNSLIKIKNLRSSIDRQLNKEEVEAFETSVKEFDINSGSLIKCVKKYIRASQNEKVNERKKFIQLTMPNNFDEFTKVIKKVILSFTAFQLDLTKISVNKNLVNDKEQFNLIVDDLSTCFQHVEDELSSLNRFMQDNFNNLTVDSPVNKILIRLKSLLGLKSN